MESARFMHVSTDKVYGSLEPDDPTFTESSPYRPNFACEPGFLDKWVKGEAKDRRKAVPQGSWFYMEVAANQGVSGPAKAPKDQ